VPTAYEPASLQGCYLAQPYPAEYEQLNAL